MKLSDFLLRLAVVCAAGGAWIASGANLLGTNNAFLSKSQPMQAAAPRQLPGTSEKSQSPTGQRRHARTSAEVAHDMRISLLKDDEDFTGDLQANDDDDDEVDSLEAEAGGILDDEESFKEHGADMSETQEVEESEGEEKEEEAGGDAVTPKPETGGLKDVFLRPSAKDDKADVVGFSMYAKGFFGADLKGKSFGIDNIMTLSWKDSRVIPLIPEGMDTITLSRGEAERLIWMPDIDITNREINSIARLSLATILDRQGMVSQVDRYLVRAKNTFSLKKFPFDTQKLRLKIASEKYMFNELKLKPIMSDSGVKEGIFASKGYFFQELHLYEEEEIDGNLRKSRGVLEITVNSDRQSYLENHVLPAAIYLMISWGVFWIPFGPPQFSTPRLALSILALLVFTKLLIQTNSQLPLVGPDTWNDCLNEHIATLMCATIGFNIYAEFAFHQLKCEDAAKAINHELKLLFPLTAACVVGFILLNAMSADGLSLETTGILAKLIMGLMLGTHFLYWAHHLWNAEKKFVVNEAKAARRASVALFHTSHDHPNRRASVSTGTI